MARKVTPAKRDTDGAGTVARAMGVLDVVASFGRPVRASEIQTESELPKGTLYRFLQTLTEQGMLSYDPDRRVYFMGVRLLRLAHAAWKQSSLAPAAHPHLDALAQDVRETIHLAQLDGGHVLYVDKLYPSRPVEMFSNAGKIGPAYCTGVGKAMLAHLGEEQLERVLPMQSFYRFTENTITSVDALRRELEKIRAAGFACDNEEHERGINCIAVPILSANGIMLGALSVTTLMGRQDSDEQQRLVPVLQDTARKIAVAAADWRFPEIEKPILTVGT